MKTAIAIALVVLIAVTPTLAVITAPDPNPVLQAAVNAYASIGIQTSCASYETHNIGTAQNSGGIITNNVCNVGGQWVDADLTVQLSSAQLDAAVRTGTGDALKAVGFDGNDPSTQQISATVSAPTSVNHSPVLSSGPGVGAMIAGAASAGCAVGGLAVSILSGGGATEVTQLCNAAQLAQHLIQLRGSLDLAKAQARSLSSLSSYGRTLPIWNNAASVDTYGRNSGWIQNANGAIGAYRRIVSTLPNMDAVLMRMNPASADATRNAYSRVELSDGVNSGAMDVVGSIRRDASGNMSRLSALQATAIDPSEGANSAVAVANKTALGTVTIAGQMEDLKRLNVAMLEQHILAEQDRREGAVAAMRLNRERLLRSAEARQQTANASDAIRGFSFQ